MTAAGTTAGTISSLAGIEADHQHDVAFLDKLAKLTRGKLSEADGLNAALSAREHRERIEAHALGLQFLPLNHMRGLPEEPASSPVSRTPGSSRGSSASPPSRTTGTGSRGWTGLPAYVDQTIALLQEGVRRKMVWPRVVLERIPPQLDPLVTGATHRQHLLRALLK